MSKKKTEAYHKDSLSSFITKGYFFTRSLEIIVLKFTPAISPVFLGSFVCESSKLSHILILYLLHKKAGSAIIEKILYGSDRGKWSVSGNYY